MAVGDGIVSASADWIRFQNTGSVPKLTVPASQVGNVHPLLNCAHGSPTGPDDVVLDQRLCALLLFNYFLDTLASPEVDLYCCGSHWSRP